MKLERLTIYVCCLSAYITYVCAIYWHILHAYWCHCLYIYICVWRFSINLVLLVVYHVRSVCGLSIEPSAIYIQAPTVVGFCLVFGLPINISAALYVYGMYVFCCAWKYACKMCAQMACELCAVLGGPQKHTWRTRRALRLNCLIDNPTDGRHVQQGRAQNTRKGK